MAVNMEAIDRSKPLRWSYHRTGVIVYMYKDKPGYYYDPHGNELPAQIAKEAGFDVEELGRERQIMEAKAKAAAEIEAEMRVALNSKTEIDAGNGFKLFKLGKSELYTIEDAQGRNVTPSALPKADAETLFKHLKGADAEPEKSKKKASKDASDAE